MMRSPRLAGTLSALTAPAILALTLVSCGHCLQPLCPLPIAITITVTAAANGGPVTGAFVQVSVSGFIGETTPCTPACFVPGYGGTTYSLEVGAPGFQTAHRTVAVPGATPAECDCGSATTEHLDVALVASP